MRRFALATLLVTLGWAATGTAAHSQAAAALCVGGTPGCFSTIQAAVDAAQDGDTINVGPGTFAGGITIDKGIQLVGTAAGATIIRGGGPVITIGDGVGTPTVSLERVTITGGSNTSKPDPSFPQGGGVWIRPAAGNATGATVSIADAVISHNRVNPVRTLPPALCGFVCAFATGGGIENHGTLTVEDTRITDNVAGSTAADPSVASYAAGGGIWNAFQGTLVLRRSVVSGNRAAVNPPNGRNTDGGGIVNIAVLTVEDSVIGDNTSDVEASVQSSFPADVQQEANAGGLYLAGGSSTTIRSSRISGNTVHSSNAAGDVEAEAGGIDSDGSLLLIGSTIDHNSATGTVPASSGFLVEADGGGMQVQDETTVRDSRITDNSLSVTSETGIALGSGGGVFNLSGSLTLERTVVAANSASATGVGGFNLGGGITNVLFGGGPPELTLTDSVITANRLAASDGIVSQGGGLYTADPFSGDPFPTTMTRTVIEGNQPNQCVGC